MKHITLFETAAAYNAATLDLPNVSLVKETMNVSYNPWVDPYGGHDYVEIGHRKWATMNIGANSITDTGLYFQWGDTQGYTADQVGSGEGQKYFDLTNYKYSTDTDITKYNTTDGKTKLDFEDDAARAAWGGPWRMPTIYEFQTLGNLVNREWTTNYQGSGVAGLVCTAKIDSSKILFFPACGGCINNSIISAGSEGNYWSSTLNNNNIQRSYNFYLSEYNVFWSTHYYRYGGLSVRPVAD